MITKHGRTLFLAAVIGGVGAGKTAVCQIFEKLGLPVIYADQIARNTCKYKEIREELLKLFGEKIMSDGVIDRIKLGKLVFEHQEEREKMEAVVFPVVEGIIAVEIERWIADGLPIGILDIPVLEKSSLRDKVDEIIFVEADDEDRLKRVISSRGWDADELKQREKAQISLEEKRATAKYVIVNTRSTSLEELSRQCEEILSGWKNI